VLNIFLYVKIGELTESIVSFASKKKPSNGQPPLVIDEFDLPLPFLCTKVFNMPSWLLSSGKPSNGQWFMNMLFIVFPFFVSNMFLICSMREKSQNWMMGIFTGTPYI